MKIEYIADTGVFVRCGGPNADKYQRLRRAVRQADVELLIPRRVHLELEAAVRVPSPRPQGATGGSE